VVILFVNIVLLELLVYKELFNVKNAYLGNPFVNNMKSLKEWKNRFIFSLEILNLF